MGCAYASGEDLQDQQTVADLEAVVDRKRSEHSHLVEIHRALSVEIEQCQLKPPP
jgi:hypothetical protein